MFLSFLEQFINLDESHKIIFGLKKNKDAKAHNLKS